MSEERLRAPQSYYWPRDNVPLLEESVATSWTSGHMSKGRLIE
jgi:hypothetical protein